MRWLVTVVLGVVVLGLFVLNVAVFGYLALEKSQVSARVDNSCPQPGTDTSGPFTPSKWQWVPPGRVCVYETRTRTTAEI